MNGYTADPGVIEQISQTLRAAADDLDAIGGSVPAAPDAGEVSGMMAAALSKLTHGAGELVVGATAAGDAVANGGAAYAEQEATAKDSLPTEGQG
ncbi:hypothetical protein [Prauserella endophytica]|uniref:ESX-1 secretion-associated protein n=1 Tax=Prauserella endophytica TaxID=1592324 RepID=A0ABY2RX77_9PSEU|nr:hypothetical protein [Prauserella endophytica]TKG64253.1 hypothetical protein FCN18_28995 [Prauserella endophytica]